MKIVFSRKLTPFFPVQSYQFCFYFSNKIMCCKQNKTNNNQKWVGFSLVTSLAYFSLPPKLEVLEALLWGSSVPLAASLFSVILELQCAQWTQMSAWAGPNFLAISERNLRAGPNLRPKRRVRWSSVKSGSAEPSILCSRNT